MGINADESGDLYQNTKQHKICVNVIRNECRDTDGRSFSHCKQANASVGTAMKMTSAFSSTGKTSANKVFFIVLMFMETSYIRRT